MKIKFLLSTQRSGSHFLKSYIGNNFRETICTGEILRLPDPLADQKPALASSWRARFEALRAAAKSGSGTNRPQVSLFWPWYEQEARANRISITPDRRIPAFHDYLLGLCALVEPRNLLVDIKYNSIRSLSAYGDTDDGSREFTSYVVSHEIPVLHLIRRNALRVILSYKLAHQTGIWHRQQERSPTETLPKMRIEPLVLLNDLNAALKVERDYQKSFSDYPHYQEIFYEEFLREPDFPHPGESVRALAHFLNETPVESSRENLPFKKTTPDDLSAIVEDWDEVVRLFQTTEHAWMLPAPAACKK